MWRIWTYNARRKRIYKPSAWKYSKQTAAQLRNRQSKSGEPFMPMYKNYFFNLYGTLVDIRTDERKPSLWYDLAEFYSLCGAPYALEEIRERYLFYPMSRRDCCPCCGLSDVGHGGSGNWAAQRLQALVWVKEHYDLCNAGIGYCDAVSGIVFLLPTPADGRCGKDA